MEYSFNQLLQEIANGKRQITIKFPEVDTPIKAIITDINLINPDWKPFKVNIISKGLQITDYRWVEHDFIGEVKEEYQRPYTEDWIKVESITDIDFEEGQQIEMPL
jgi:peroxiredoxin